MEEPMDITIQLSEVAPGGLHGGYKNRHDGGKKLPQVIVNETVTNDANFQLKAKLSKTVHGKLSQDGDTASLLIFEFDLTAPSNRRFKRATIQITFVDSGKESQYDPQVHKISPKGMWHLNKHTTVQEVSHGVETSVSAQPVPGIGIGLGYHWSMSKQKEKTSCARLNGKTDSTRPDSEETIAKWIMEEDERQRSGIPTFLTAAVILRHEADEARGFHIMVEIDAVEYSRLYGKAWFARTLEPMWLAPGVFQGVVEDPANLDKVDLSTESMIRIAQVLSA